MSRKPKRRKKKRAVPARKRLANRVRSFFGNIQLWFLLKSFVGRSLKPAKRRKRRATRSRKRSAGRIRTALGSLSSIAMGNAVPLATSLVLALLFSFLVWQYTSGGLLFGGDLPGFYSFQQALSDPTHYGFMYAIPLALTSGNYYASFYAVLFISTFLNVLAIYYLALELFRDNIDSSFLSLVAILSSLLYLLNPIILRNGYVSLLSNVSVANFGFFLFLIELIRFYRVGEKERRFGYSNAAIMGLGLGFSLRTFPDAARILAVGIGLFLYFLFFRHLFSRSSNRRQRTEWSQTLRLFLVFILATLMVGSFVLLPLVLNPSAAFQQASAGNKEFGPGFYTGYFNNILQTLRGFNVVFFDGTIYSPLYYSNILVTLASTLLPLFVLCVPLLISDKKTLKTILPIELLALITIFWSKGANPPLGGIFTYITKSVPFGLGLIPTYFLGPLLLSETYSLLTAYSVVLLGFLFLKSISSNRMRIKSEGRLMFGIFLLALTIPAFVEALPLLNGQLLNGPFISGQRGFIVPQDYQNVKNYLLQQNQSAVVLPASGRYVATAWGYAGSVDFYNRYFSPANTYVINTFGLYAGFNPSNLSTYINMSFPIAPTGPYRTLNYSLSTPQSLGINSLTLNNTLLLNYTNQTNFSIDFPLKKGLSINNFTYVMLRFRVSNQSQFLSAINGSGFSIALKSSVQKVGWYTISNLCQLCYINNTGNGWFNVSLMVEQANEQVPIPEYNASNIHDFRFRFNNVSAMHNFSIGYPTIYGANKYNLKPAWFQYLHQYNVGYILVDNTFVYGTTQTYKYVIDTLQYLTNAGHLQQVYKGVRLRLYKIS